MSRGKAGILVATIGILLIVGMASLAVVNRHTISSLRKEKASLRQQISAQQSAVSKITSENVDLHKQVAFLQSAYTVDYGMVKGEFDSLRARYQGKGKIGFPEIKAAVVDLQHAWSILTLGQKNTLAREVNDLLVGTKVMHAYAGAKNDQVWEILRKMNV